MDVVQKTRLGELRNGTAEELVANGDLKGQVQLLFTSPPWRTHSTFNAYVDWLRITFEGLADLLKPDGSMVVVLASDWRTDARTQEPTQTNAPFVALGELGRVLPICQMFVVLHDLPVTSPSVSDPVSELVRGGRRSEDIVEYAWWFGTKPKAHMAFDNVVFANRDGRDVEYRSMPVAVPHRFVRMLTDRGDLVLDPFAGSNSTGVAAEGRGRRWVSVEAESLACARAARRLK